MKKKIDPLSITNELKGASSFFRPVRQDRPSPNPAPLPASQSENTERQKHMHAPMSHPLRNKQIHQKEGSRTSVSLPPSESPNASISRNRDTMGDTTIPRYHDTILETARRAVKQFGKEAATH